MNHFIINFGSFSSTTVEFGAKTPEGRIALAKMLGEGAISANVQKSKAPEFLDRLIALLPEGAAADQVGFAARTSGLTRFYA